MWLGDLPRRSLVKQNGTTSTRAQPHLWGNSSIFLSLQISPPPANPEPNTIALLPLVAAILLLAPTANAQANPCLNGSFEDVAPNGFPVAWGPIGKAEVAGDAHSGKRALRLLRTNEPPTSETGVNGPNLDRLRGGIDFHYKAVAAKDVVLHIYAIPIAADGIEKTGAPRAGFVVPKDHVGDGKWHHARLKYDFTKNAKVKTVIFAARLEGTSGELLLDDFSYIDRVGPMLRVGTIRIEEDPKRPGELCTVSAPVENTGDEPVKDVRVAMEAPKGLKASPAEVRLGDVAPDGKLLARWTLEGDRVRAETLRLVATSGDQQTTARLDIAPQLVVTNWGPTSPVFLAGQPITVECALHNAGTASVLKPRVLILFGTFPPSSPAPGALKTVEVSAERIVPGRRVTLRATLPPSPGPLLIVKRRVSAVNVPPTSPKDPEETAVLVSPAGTLPAPSDAMKARATADYALLENEHVRLVFRRVMSLWAGGEISVKTRTHWHTVAWILQLLPELTIDSPPESEMSPNGSARLRFSGKLSETGPVAITFDLQPRSKTIAACYEIQVKRAAAIKFFPSPVLFVLDRDEAIFPGVEWLVEEELSSGTLDIAESHPDRIRHVVHPNWITVPAIGIHGRHGTVGLLWDVHQKWDGTRDRPGVYFGSPDRAHHHRSHQISLFLPNPPEFVKANTSEITSQKEYRLEPGKPLKLEALIYADGEAKDALAAVDQWIKAFGVPQPAALPRGSYEREIEFSMQAYLKSLWVPEEKKWWTSKGAGELLSPKGLPRSYVADLLVGDLLSPDREVRRQCRARAEEVLKIIGGPARLDAQRFPGRLDSALASSAQAASLLMSRGKDGAWRFDADQVGTGPFVGLDYHELGPNNAAEVGLCAAKAAAILRYARITGDWEAYRQMIKTLEFMEQFRVPRAAQVWEVPVHSPDILAAAEAAEAYLEAYRFSGEKRWLRNAVTWARRGLPFVYLWNDPEKPFLVGASIPVFGASWMQASWFGRPVQWNGLRYAEALLELAEYDQSYPWRQIATALTHSAIHQQDMEGENVALWPDSIGAVQGDKSAWVFAPRMIITNILKLMGRDEHIRTAIVGAGERRLHISANAALSEAKWDGSTCTFRVTYPAGEQGTVVVFNTAKPQAVMLDGKTLTERADLEGGSEPGWRYESGTCCLSVRVPKDGASTIRVEGAAFRSTPRLPQLAERIAFEFAETPEGWLPVHDVDELTVRDGLLTGRITGGDPYLARIMLRVRGDDSPVIAIRMRATGGRGGQWFWMTEASPAFTEDKSIRLNVQPDGDFHEYRLEVGKHAAWAGQTITGLRIDPSDGAPSGELAIDYVRGVSPRTAR